MFLLAQEEPASPVSRIDPQLRVKLIATLAGLIILGLGLMALAWLGARVARRYMNQGMGSGRYQLDPDDWARKNSAPNGRAVPPPSEE